MMPEKLMKGFLLEAEPTARAGKPGVRLLVKEKSGRLVPVFAPFSPYFYLVPADGSKEALEAAVGKAVAARTYVRGREAKVTHVETVERKLGGESRTVLKVHADAPGHVPKLREELKSLGETYEFGIPFTRRFLIDHQLVPSSEVEIEFDVGKREATEVRNAPRASFSPPPALRVLSFDIETYNPASLPDAKKDRALLISYSAGGSDGKEGVISYAHNAPHKTFVTQVADERAMLEAFARVVRNERADILAGYNSDEFDLPFLAERAKQLKADFNLSRSKNGRIAIRKLGVRSRASIVGRVHYDAFSAASFLGTIGAFKFPRLTLGAVYETLTREKKLDTAKFEIWKAYDAGGAQLSHLLDYSLADAVACRKVTEFVLPLSIALSRVTGLGLFDASRATSGQMVEALLMRRAFERGEIVPNKPGYAAVEARANDAIVGAYVKMPLPGVYENIAVFDFRSLYPSIIVSHNIDPATLNCSCCKPEESFTAPTGARFCRKKRGLVPETLEKVLDERAKLKADLKGQVKGSDDYKQLDARQWGLKILANSVAADEPLVLLSPENEVVVATAKEFVDPRLGNETIWSTQLGNAPGWKSASFNALGMMEFKPITKVMRHKCSSMLSLKLSSGRSVKITNDHSVFSLNGEGEIVPKAGCDIAPGSLVIVPKKIPSPNLSLERLNMAQALSRVPESELTDVIVTLRLERPTDVLAIDNRILDEVNGEQNVLELASKIRVHRKTIGEHLRYLLKEGVVAKVSAGRAMYSLTEKAEGFRKFIEFSRKLVYNGNKREHFALFNSVRGEICGLDDKYLEGVRIGAINGTRIPALIPFSEETASLIGYYVSEGCSRKWLNQTNGYSYRVDITNYDQKVLDSVFIALKKMGFRPNRSLHHVCVNNKSGYLVFKHVLKCGEGAYEKTIPSQILSATPSLKWAFLKSYFEGDGNYEKRAKRFRFTTVSKKLTTDLVVLLNQLGISGVSIKRDSKFNRIVVNEPLFFGERKYFRTFAFNVPGSLIEPEIKSLGRKQFYRHLSGGVHKEALEKFYGEYRKQCGESRKIERLLAFMNSDLAVDKVLEKREEIPEGFVYDLSVEGNENFIGGNGLICLHNSTYGYLVYSRSRYYSKECGEAITAWGRQHIQAAMRSAEEAGFPVLYLDTDSLFLLLGKKSKEEALAFRDSINRNLPKGMELELEDFYPRGIFVSKKQGEKGAKKKYALINEKGFIKIRGFELVRRDWSPIARETQRRVLDVILREGDLAKALLLVKDVIGELKEGRVPLTQLAIRTQLRKSAGSYEVKSPELAAFLHAREGGMQIGEHSLIEYVITKKGKTISEKSQLLELAKDYDADYYINNQVLPAVLKIVGTLGVKEGDVKAAGTQKGLGGW